MPPPHPSKTLLPVICCYLFSSSSLFLLSILSSLFNLFLCVSFPPFSLLFFFPSPSPAIVSLYLFSLSRSSQLESLAGTAARSSRSPVSFTFSVWPSIATSCTQHSRLPSLRYLATQTSIRVRYVPAWLVAKQFSLQLKPASLHPPSTP